MLTNMKKDSAIRRIKKYVVKQERPLQIYQQGFEQNHNESVKLQIPNHEYHNIMYKDQVQKIYNSSR